MKPWTPSTEECLAIEEAIKAARQVQTFLWGEANGAWGLEEWLRMFRKRVAKLEEVKRDNPHAAIELKKRLLQTAALSVALCGIIERDGVPWEAAPDAPPSNLPQFGAAVNASNETRATSVTPSLDALLANSEGEPGAVPVGEPVFCGEHRVDIKICECVEKCSIEECERDRFASSNFCELHQTRATSSTPSLDALLADGNRWRGNMSVRKAFAADTQVLQGELAEVRTIAERRLEFIERVCEELGISLGDDMFEKVLSRVRKFASEENWALAYDKVCRERDEILNMLGRIAYAANAGQSNLSREESVTVIITRLTSLKGYQEDIDRHVFQRKRLRDWMSAQYGQDCSPPDSPEEAAIRVLRELEAKLAGTPDSPLSNLPQCSLPIGVSEQNIECECWEGRNNREGMTPCIHERLPKGGGPFENTSSPGKCRCGADGPPWKHKSKCQYD